MNNDNIDKAGYCQDRKIFEIILSFPGYISTIRTAEEEFNLVTAKLGQVFKCQKFIISNKDLSEQGLIAQIMFQEMDVPEKFRDVWWEEMKSHVHKKWMSGNQTVALLSKMVLLVCRNACF